MAADTQTVTPPRGEFPETLILWHVGVLAVATSWCFGGQVWWARDAIALWGSLGLIIFFAGTGVARRWAEALRLLWPLLAYDALVIASCFNPGFETRVIDGTPVYLIRDAIAWLPSSARPDLSARELWQFNGIVVSCANLALFITRRRHLRRLLAVVAANTVLLAVFGTLQKLSGAKALIFGLFPTRQEYFFSTFVYHNHWGAFVVLTLAAGVGLIFHFERRGGHRDFWHSPTLTGGVAAVLVAATAPLSGSRSSTVLVGLLLLAAVLQGLVRLAQRRRELHESPAPPLVAFGLCVVLALGAVGWIARDVIARRADHTVRQFAEIQREQTLNSRLAVYRDTWRMAMDKPWFGWGLESYADAFRIYNSQRTAERWVPYYAEAHNDWFQSFAETGAVGTALLLWLGLLPLARDRSGLLASPIPRYLLLGCGLVLLYAWVEFPLANPAVLIAFWLSLYAAVRLAELGRLRHSSSAS